MAQKKEKEFEEQEENFACSVCLTDQVIVNFYGPKKKIFDELKFLYRAVMFPEEKGSDDDDACKYVPVTIFAEDDLSDIRCFSLRNYSANLKNW